MKRPQYFAAKPLEEEYIPIENEVVLWRSVLDQAMQDIAYTGVNKEYIKFREDAIEWLFNDEEDFELICDFAMLDAKKSKEEFYYIMGVTNDQANQPLKLLRVN